MPQTLQLQSVFLHEGWHELLAFTNRPLFPGRIIVSSLIRRQSVLDAVLRQAFADTHVQAMPSLSHTTQLSTCTKEEAVRHYNNQLSATPVHSRLHLAIE